MSEEAVLKKLEAIRTSGSKGELWNFEVATILNMIIEYKNEIEMLKENVEGYRGLAKQIQEDYEQRLEDYYNEG